MNVLTDMSDEQVLGILVTLYHCPATTNRRNRSIQDGPSDRVTSTAPTQHGDSAINRGKMDCDHRDEQRTAQSDRSASIVESMTRTCCRPWTMTAAGDDDYPTEVTA